MVNVKIWRLTHNNPVALLAFSAAKRDTLNRVRLTGARADMLLRTRRTIMDGGRATEEDASAFAYSKRTVGDMSFCAICLVALQVALQLDSCVPGKSDGCYICL